MKITNVSNFVGYKKEVSKIKKAETTQSKNYDTIQISKNSGSEKSNQATHTDDVKNKIVNELNSETEPEKIEKLRAQVNMNSYVVDSKELAKILLSI